jgi:hypothetical protein
MRPLHYIAAATIAIAASAAVFCPAASAKDFVYGAHNQARVSPRSFRAVATRASPAVAHAGFSARCRSGLLLQGPADPTGERNRSGWPRSGIATALAGREWDAQCFCLGQNLAPASARHGNNMS